LTNRNDLIWSNQASSPESYTDKFGNVLPDSLTPDDFNASVLAYFVQFCLYDLDEVPFTIEQIRHFDKSSFENSFRDFIKNGGGEELILNRMATIDEMMISWQLFDYEEKASLVLSEDLISNKPDTQFVLPTFLKVKDFRTDFIHFVSKLSPQNKILVSDGKSFHIITSIGLMLDEGKFIFKDNIGEGSKCYLSKGGNYKNTNAEFAMHDPFGNWIWHMSVGELFKVLYGIVIPESRAKQWSKFELNPMEELAKNIGMSDFDNLKTETFKLFDSLFKK